MKGIIMNKIDFLSMIVVIVIAIIGWSMGGIFSIIATIFIILYAISIPHLQHHYNLHKCKMVCIIN